MVAQTCNRRCVGARDLEDGCLRPAWEKEFRRLHHSQWLHVVTSLSSQGRGEAKQEDGGPHQTGKKSKTLSKK
jgi:hypothetical protein